MGHPAFFAKKTRLVTFVSDTSPISYLVLIGAGDMLSALYGKVMIPEAVQRELRPPQGPEAVREWISLSPPWLVVEEIRPDVQDREHNGGLDPLDPGERAAILLAEQEEISLLLIDERTGRKCCTDSRPGGHWDDWRAWSRRPERARWGRTGRPGSESHFVSGIV